MPPSLFLPRVPLARHEGSADIHPGRAGDPDVAGGAEVLDVVQQAYGYRPSGLQGDLLDLRPAPHEGSRYTFGGLVSDLDRERPICLPRRKVRVLVGEDGGEELSALMRCLETVDGCRTRMPKVRRDAEFGDRAV